ncbi:MAG: hypothetical protein ACREXI_14330, partial [Caldimonas sp.]
MHAPLFGRWPKLRRADIPLSPLALDAMRHLATTPPLLRSSHPLHHGGAIEWEELPSLADTLAERLVVLGTRHRDAVV